ncbi:MAG: hypothetical protein HY800_07340, partial [Ignavibacteriales bacterium]|nr:hypothetical protein [Ignavibacteriales bacterium]
MTVPLLYAPIEKDSMFMVDGGLRSNIPVDIARSLGCDIVIVVNSTSSMRKPEQMKAPWEIADQIMTIMMQESNQRQLELADIIITPLTGERIVSDFSGLDTLISSGEHAAEGCIPKIIEMINECSNVQQSLADSNFKSVSFELSGDTIDERLMQEIFQKFERDTLSQQDVEECLNQIYNSGKYDNVYAEVTPYEDETKIIINVLNPDTIKEFRFSGNELVGDSIIEQSMTCCIGQDAHSSVVQNCLEDIQRIYRKMGYSLARIESVNVEKKTGILSFKINEGKIAGIRFDGNVITKDYIIRREFPLDLGEVFNIDKASQGVVNIKSTGLFEYIFLNVRYENDQPVVILRVKERSSELIRLGFHADEEHGIVSTIDIRDANFRGAWEDLGLVMRYGYRDRFARAEYTVNRIFHTYFTFNIKGYYRSRDVFTYSYAPSASSERWERTEYGKYREIRYGSNIVFGS